MNLFAGIFCLGGCLFIWLFLGIKKGIIDWKKEFGEIGPTPMLITDLLLGLLCLILSIWNFGIWMTK